MRVQELHPCPSSFSWVCPEGMFAYDNSWLPSLGWLWCPLLYLAYKSSNKGKSISLCILIMEKAEPMGPGQDSARRSTVCILFHRRRNSGRAELFSNETISPVSTDSFREEWLLEMGLSWLSSFLMGLKDQPDLQLRLFFLFLRMYVLTVMGNLSLIILIQLNSHLHTPVYFFLFNLSFIDFSYSSVFTPKMLINFTSNKNIISYMGRVTQRYCFCFFVISECYVLTSMAYDRYVAICNPLLYNAAMSPKVCSSLMLASYLMALSGAMLTLDACWDWLPVMQTPSTIISVMSSFCSLSCTST